MSKIDSSILWGPEVLGSGPLDERFSAYLVEAPFDMPAHAPDLVGERVSLGGTTFQIRGVAANAPSGPISKGDRIQLLVRAV
jgi:hypothetical protein